MPISELPFSLPVDFILTEANENDWLMHLATKPIHIIGKYDSKQRLLSHLPKDTEFIIIRDYKSDVEYEFSIIFKHENLFYFATDVSDL